MIHRGSWRPALAAHVRQRKLRCSEYSFFLSETGSESSLSHNYLPAGQEACRKCVWRTQFECIGKAICVDCMHRRDGCLFCFLPFEINRCVLAYALSGLSATYSTYTLFVCV